MDASLDPAVYLQLAKSRGWSIRHVLDTHVHADHLSRSRSLAEQACATLWLPEQRRIGFEHRALRDGSTIRFGAILLEALSTPGHTTEGMCYRVDQRWLLTGDTLFLSGVGRPDLEASREEARARAILLHRSLNRLFALDPTLLVLPAHTSHPIAFDHLPIAATLNIVREAVRLPADPAVFTDHVLTRIPATPPNHHAIVTLNEAGELPTGDLTDLELGANRCAIS